MLDDEDREAEALLDVPDVGEESLDLPGIHACAGLVDEEEPW